MRCKRLLSMWLVLGGAAALTVVLCSGLARAESPPRPWLCRELPVFSAPQPLHWSAVRRGSGDWLMTFMRYDPSGGGHDGFTVVATQMLRSRTSGRLGRGRYYAAALYRKGGHWICPANASDYDDLPAHEISEICFGEDVNSCDVKLTATSVY